MSKLLKIALATAALTAMVACAANAGLNAGVANNGALYWVAGTGVSANRNSTLCTPKFIVSVAGLTNFRGADVQIFINGVGQQLPPAWQMQTGGCNGDNFLNTLSRSFASPYPTAFTGVSGVADGQMQMYYNWTGSSCNLTPHGVGFLWLESVGVNGAAKTATTRYGLYTVAVDLSQGLCPGDCAYIDPNTGQPIQNAPVCIAPNFQAYCTDKNHPYGYGVYGVLDGNLLYDYVTCPANVAYLTWNPAGAALDCPGVVPVGPTSWGKLKNMYR